MECERVIPRDILDDLCSRFIINVPDEERRDLIRICFQIESAHWFYLDFYSKHFPTKKPCGIKEFAQQIFKVYEETGFDISNLINPNEYIEANVNDQVVRLYLIPGINKQEKFEPKTRNEIKAVNWFPICDIPSNKKQATLKLGTGANTFFLVSPFLRRLRQWIFDHNHCFPTKHFRRQRHKSCSDIDCIRYKASDLNLKESVAMIRSFKDKKGNFIDTITDSACKVEDSIKGNDKQIEIFRPNILEQPICYELSGLLNSAIHDSFYKTCQTKQFSLEQFQKNNDCLANVNHFDKLSKTIVVVQSKESLYNNFIENIPKMETSISILSEETPVQETCSTSPIKSPLKQNINILSNESAFRRVEKSGKNKKRNRCKKNLKSIKSDDINLSHSESNGEHSTKTFYCLPNEFPVISDINELSNKSDLSESFFVENDQILEEQPFIGVPGWINFKFDLNAIMRSMEEVTHSRKKQ
nr:uncharacterized protein LOC106689574 isoform X1 [Halyomorpha halys]XP_014290116.2 uncharacterized protein LOC106689574 isoform X1 [Halyomorpha halys]XP_014290117.2 uncharacterized protein LOC106689574 isoform X1 [Halyomorpha halys]